MNVLHWVVGILVDVDVFLLKNTVVLCHLSSVSHNYNLPVTTLCRESLLPAPQHYDTCAFRADLGHLRTYVPEVVLVRACLRYLR